MLHILITINSALLVLATIFLVFAIGHAILTWSGTMLLYAIVIFVVLLISELVLSLYSS